MALQLRRLLRYSLILLALFPLQLAFLGLSKLCYMAADALLLDMSESVYLAVNGLGLGLGHFLAYLLLRFGLKLRPEGFLAALQGLAALSLYFGAKNMAGLDAAEGYTVFYRMYLWSFLWFLLFTGFVLFVDFLRYRAQRKREA